jgi:hypothetical protein
MRATFITTALEDGAQLEYVQKAAGHRDPGTTKLYDRRGYNTRNWRASSQPIENWYARKKCQRKWTLYLLTPVFLLSGPAFAQQPMHVD